MRSRCAERRGAQRDAAAHRPAHQDDPARAVRERDVDRGLGVLPFGRAEVVHPVGRGGGADVVAVGDRQAGQPQPVQERDHPQRFSPRGAVAVDEDRPGVLAAGGGAVLRAGAHQPGRHMADRGFDGDLLGGQPVRGLRGPRPEEAVAAGAVHLQRLVGVHGQHGPGDGGRGGASVDGAQAHVDGAAALAQSQQAAAAGGARLIEMDAIRVRCAHRDVRQTAQALPGHQRQARHHPGSHRQGACAECEHRGRTDRAMEQHLWPSGLIGAMRDGDDATDRVEAGAGREGVTRHTAHPSGGLGLRL